jgi:hypothetical protein
MSLNLSDDAGNVMLDALSEEAASKFCRTPKAFLRSCYFPAPRPRPRSTARSCSMKSSRNPLHRLQALPRLRASSRGPALKFFPATLAIETLMR